MPASAIAAVRPDATKDEPQTPFQRLLILLFFLSGISALIYQVVWQRSLFAIYGINVESVTVVVSAFMLGLGLGSIAGGYVSRLKLPLMAVFGAVELCTALYGIFSLSIFHRVALYTSGASTAKAGCLAFALVALPTLLMGSTLPILVAYAVQQVPNMGRCTGLLYCVNTLGSATACLLTGMFLMRLQGQSGSIRLAALINAVVGFCALASYWDSRGRDTSGPPAVVEMESAGAAAGLPFWIGMTLAALSGLVALAYEIVWYRVFAFASATKPTTFAYLLAFYLAGLALGSVVVERLCNRGWKIRQLLWVTGSSIVVGNLFALLVIPLYGTLSWMFPWVAQFIAFTLVSIAAAQFGTTFPLVCHLTTRPDSNAGRRLSYLYFSNIIGSTAGSLLVGFVLMEFLTLRQVSLALALVGVALGLAVLLRGQLPTMRVAAIAVVSLVGIADLGARFDKIYEHLLFQERNAPAFADVVENRHGVIAITHDGAVFGGGAYDGKFNVDPVHDTNGIIRAYTIMGIHPAPREVLLVGLSSGSWAQVVANSPLVEHLTIVEINPGYLPLIPKHPEVASLLRNPKVTVVIDDGRRWLLRNPDAKFDLVVMNTTLHWRAHATNLLSVEFLSLIAQHLKPGGIHFYNTTDSPEAQLTACAVFPHALRVGNFMTVSDSPIQLDKVRVLETLANYTIDQKPIIPDPQHSEAAQRLFTIIANSVDTVNNDSPGQYLEWGRTVKARYRDREIVTDDNMATEWR